MDLKRATKCHIVAIARGTSCRESYELNIWTDLVKVIESAVIWNVRGGDSTNPGPILKETAEFAGHFRLRLAAIEFETFKGDYGNSKRYNIAAALGYGMRVLDSWQC